MGRGGVGVWAPDGSLSLGGVMGLWGGGLRGPGPWVGYRALGLEAVMWPWGGLQGLQSRMGYGVLGLG